MKVRLCDFFTFNRVYANTIGLEIEVEGNGKLGRPLAGLEDTVWRTHTDGSLRNYLGGSCEFVTNGPIDEKSVFDQVVTLNSTLKKNGVVLLEESPRTSVHVHINCQLLSVDEMMQWLGVYILCEDRLLSYVGEGRRGNLFCLPLVRQRQVQSQVSGMFGLNRTTLNKDSKQNLAVSRLYSPSLERVKYCALNVGRLPSFGTFEFRSLFGTVDPVIIQEWVDLLLAVRDFGLKNTLEETWELYERVGPQNFFEMVFGSNNKHLKTNPENQLEGERCFEDLYRPIEYNIKNLLRKAPSNNAKTTVRDPIPERVRVPEPTTFTAFEDLINTMQTDRPDPQQIRFRSAARPTTDF